MLLLQVLDIRGRRLFSAGNGTKDVLKHLPESDRLREDAFGQLRALLRCCLQASQLAIIDRPCVPDPAGEIAVVVQEVECSVERILDRVDEVEAKPTRQEARELIAPPMAAGLLCTRCRRHQLASYRLSDFEE